MSNNSITSEDIETFKNIQGGYYPKHDLEYSWTVNKMVRYYIENRYIGLDHNYTQVMLDAIIKVYDESYYGMYKDGDLLKTSIYDEHGIEHEVELVRGKSETSIPLIDKGRQHNLNFMVNCMYKLSLYLMNMEREYDEDIYRRRLRRFYNKFRLLEHMFDREEEDIEIRDKRVRVYKSIKELMLTSLKLAYKSEMENNTTSNQREIDSRYGLISRNIDSFR